MSAKRTVRTASLACLALGALGACIQDNIPSPQLELQQMSVIACTAGSSGSYTCSSQVGMIVLQGQIPLSEILVTASGAGVTTLTGNSPVNDLQATYFVQVTNSNSTCTPSNSTTANVSAVVIGTGSQILASNAGQFSAPRTCQ